GARLHLAHVHRPEEAADGVSASDVRDLFVRQAEEDYLAEVARRLAGKGPLAVTTALLEGDVAGGLKAYAEEHAIDLVILSTHARGAFARFWLGGIADDLARQLTQPVLLVRPGENPPDLAHEADLKSIVVPLDGSEQAERILPRVLEL